jgi:hypothetical protein
VKIIKINKKENDIKKKLIVQQIKYKLIQFEIILFKRNASNWKE